jgi:hypothetical protein
MELVFGNRSRIGSIVCGKMVEQVRMLLASQILCKTLMNNAHIHITRGANTYADRL